MTKTELLETAKPILFSTEMVKAILDGRKTVTRRNPFQFEFKEGQNPNWSGYSLGEYYTGHIETGACLYSRGAHEVWGVRTNVVKPKYHIGDILYVRETWCEVPYEYEHIPIKDGYITIPKIAYMADSLTDYTGTWHPSIHMPKSAARIFLKVTDVRAERLQDITVDGCKAEGIYDDYKTTSGEYHKALVEKAYPIVFSELWNSTIKKQDLDKYGWNANPWVWVYEFERVECDERK